MTGSSCLPLPTSVRSDDLTTPSYGPKPIGAFSSCGVESTLRKHQITPPQTTSRAVNIVIHPAVVMGDSLVCRLSVVQVDSLASPATLAGSDYERQEDQRGDDRDNRHAGAGACPRTTDRRAKVLHTEPDEDHDQVGRRDVLHDEFEDGREPNRCTVVDLSPSSVYAEHPREVNDLHAGHDEDEERADPEVDRTPERPALCEPERQDRADRA